MADEEVKTPATLALEITAQRLGKEDGSGESQEAIKKFINDPQQRRLKDYLSKANNAALDLAKSPDSIDKAIELASYVNAAEHTAAFEKRPRYQKALSNLAKEMAGLSPEGAAVHAAGAAKHLLEFKQPDGTSVLDAQRDGQLIIALKKLQNDSESLANDVSKKGGAGYSEEDRKEIEKLFDKAAEAAGDNRPDYKKWILSEKDKFTAQATQIEKNKESPAQKNEKKKEETPEKEAAKDDPARALADSIKELREKTIGSKNILGSMTNKEPRKALMDLEKEVKALAKKAEKKGDEAYDIANIEHINEYIDNAIKATEEHRPLKPTLKEPDLSKFTDELKKMQKAFNESGPVKKALGEKAEEKEKTSQLTPELKEMALAAFKPDPNFKSAFNNVPGMGGQSKDIGLT